MKIFRFNIFNRFSTQFGKVLPGMVAVVLFSACDKTIPGAPTDPATLARLKPIASFTHSIDSIEIGQAVTFTNTSARKPTELVWRFPGGTPSASSEQSPQVKYNQIGSYDVSLKAANSFGADSIVKKGLIRTYFKTDFSKDLSLWQIEKNWFYSTSSNIPGNSGLLAYSVLLNASTTTIDFATVRRNFTNLPNNARLGFWYYVYGPGGILNVKANGTLLGSISGFGKGYVSYEFKGGANVEITFEAVLRQTQSIYISHVTIHPL